MAGVSRADPLSGDLTHAPAVIRPRRSACRCDAAAVDGRGAGVRHRPTLQLRARRPGVEHAVIDVSWRDDARVRETPIQGSLLIFPVKAAFAPYLLGGFGWYNQSTDFLDATGKTVLTTSSKRTGWHFGLGADLQLAKHAALFGDYRYRFVHFGEAAVDDQPINIPLVSAAKLSHQGSMWTTGMAFYF